MMQWNPNLFSRAITQYLFIHLWNPFLLASLPGSINTLFLLGEHLDCLRLSLCVLNVQLPVILVPRL